MSMLGCIDMEEMMSLSSKTCTGININAVLIRIVFCKYCSHRRDRFKFCVNVKN